MEHHILTGGGGYVGRNLAAALITKGHKVTLFDVQLPQAGIPEGARFIKVFTKTQHFR